MFLYIDTPVEPTTPLDIFWFVVLILFILVAFLTRKTEAGWFLWVIVKSFFYALAIIFVANKAKGFIKDILDK